MVRGGKETICFKKDKAEIIEALCSGCGICIKKCPFSAISIVNLPDELENQCSHRFGRNSFRIYRLPTPSPGVVLGLLGQNGIGKSTTLKIFSSEIMLNLGQYSDPPSWEQIIKNFRGSTLQDYFQNMSIGKLKVSYKPQYVDRIPKAVSGRVEELLEKVDESGTLKENIKQLELDQLLSRPIEVLSGGELQRVAVLATICREADVYLIDEPSSYLDVKQRLAVAKAIRKLRKDNKIVIVAEHDLAIIDYLSDQVCVFYGKPGVYGIVSNVHGVRTGINLYLQGYIRDENVRFRDEAIIFHEKPPTTSVDVVEPSLQWKKIEKTYDGFRLHAIPGEIRAGEVIGILGPNGIGKTTFVKILAGIEETDQGTRFDGMRVSYKPQYISAEYEGTVKQLLESIDKKQLISSWYNTEILQPLQIASLLDKKVTELSGGELQKVAIISCLSKKAELYLLDEPSAYLDVEERLIMARTVRRVVENYDVTAFVVEHDVVAQDFMADRLMIFTGKPGVMGTANPPLGLREGMNKFLKDMQVTFRRDPNTKRPRVNKEGSKLDKYQKHIGEFYYVSSLKKD
jgi:ATP-binding cassette subfamily E protein 1